MRWGRKLGHEGWKLAPGMTEMLGLVVSPPSHVARCLCGGRTPKHLSLANIYCTVRCLLPSVVALASLQIGLLEGRVKSVGFFVGEETKDLNMQKQWPRESVREARGWVHW